MCVSQGHSIFILSIHTPSRSLPTPPGYSTVSASPSPGLFLQNLAHKVNQQACKSEVHTIPPSHPPARPPVFPRFYISTRGSPFNPTPFSVLHHENINISDLNRSSLWATITFEYIQPAHYYITQINMSGSDSLHPIPPNNERTMSTSSASSSSTTSTNGSNRNSAPASLPQSPTHYAYQAPIHQTSSQVQYQSNVSCRCLNSYLTCRI